MAKKRKRGGAGTDREPRPARVVVHEPPEIRPSRIMAVGPNVDPMLAIPTMRRGLPGGGTQEPIPGHPRPAPAGSPRHNEPIHDTIDVLQESGMSAEEQQRALRQLLGAPPPRPAEEVVFRGTPSAIETAVLRDTAGKLPKIEPGTVAPVPTAERVPVEQQPIRTIPGGMRVTTDPLTGVIQRDPRTLQDPGQAVPTVTSRDRLRVLLRSLLGMED